MGDRAADVGEATLPKIQLKTAILLLLVSAVPLILNGYPIVHFDTGVYSTSFKNLTSFYDVPIDRPIFYGIYVWLTSMFGSTLRLVPISQAIIFSWLLFCLINTLYGTQCRDRAYYLLIVLVASSYLPFLVSAVMPDVWTVLMALASMVLLTKGKWDVNSDAIFCAIISLAVAFAPANAFILILSLMPFAARIVKTRGTTFVTVLLSFAILPLLLCSLTTYLTFHEFKIVKGGQAFLFARFAGENNAQRGIEKVCAKSPAALVCQHKSLIKGKDSNEILWTELNQKLDLWQDKNGEIAAVIKASIEENFVSILVTAIKGTLKSLVSTPYSISELYAGPYGSDSFVFNAIKTWYPNDFLRLNASMQQSNPRFYLLQRIFLFYAITFWLEVALIFGICIYNIYKRSPITLLVKFALSFALSNAFVCAALAGFDFRYGIKGTSVVLLICTFTLLTETFTLTKPSCEAAV